MNTVAPRLDARKLRIINIISALDAPRVVEKIEALLEVELPAAQSDLLALLLEPIEEKTDLQKILLEQNYRGPNKRRFEKFAKELAIEEPIEDLLALLAK
jgi:hypothetical protein